MGLFLASPVPQHDVAKSAEATDGALESWGHAYDAAYFKDEPLITSRKRGDEKGNFDILLSVIFEETG